VSAKRRSARPAAGAGIPNRDGECEPRNLALADWPEIARRLEAVRRSGTHGYEELRKLAALLLADEVPATTTEASK